MDLRATYPCRTCNRSDDNGKEKLEDPLNSFKGTAGRYALEERHRTEESQRNDQTQSYVGNLMKKGESGR